jgi:putative ABC transport system permease protein
MIKKFIKPAWRNLRHNKTYSVINILGFAVSIAACLLIGLSVYHETRFDKDIPGNAQVYRLNEYMHYPGANPQLSADIGIPFASLLKDNHPEIETAVRVLPPSFIYPTITLEYGDKKIRTSKMICTDTSFASLFGVCMMEGDAADFIRDQHSIALTQSLARNLFGAVPAAG